MMVEKGVCKNVPIIVHSHNPEGANNMVSKLNNNGYDAAHLPFININSTEAESIVNYLEGKREAT